MDKYLVCLANSYKRGGRCIAGIEVFYSHNKQWEIVRDRDGRPHWIRPISRSTQYGEIPTEHAYGIGLCSLVKITDVSECPNQAHTENVSYSRIEVCPLCFPCSHAMLHLLTDDLHHTLFQNRGRAVSVNKLAGIDYSLMLIHVQNAHAYLDEERSKSKNRVSFTYNDTEYDLPVTDPAFLDCFRNSPNNYATIPDVYFTLSLGLEFEGWLHKLVAAVIIPTDAISNIPNPQAKDSSDRQVTFYTQEHPSWFDEYDQELERLLKLKEDIESKITELRASLLKQMENKSVSHVTSQRFTVSYSPAKTVMQFDGRTFRAENEELYSRYCKPKQREASITVKRIKDLSDTEQ